MNKIKKSIITLVLLCSTVFCVGEAGAIFLLINPGAGAAGVGEAQVAKANDAYATYYNPAGLGFMKESEVVLQHVNWLPNLANDIFYDFIGVTHSVEGLGTFGGHLIYLNLGEQVATDEYQNDLGTFKSYMMALTASYGMQLNESSSVGLNFKVFHQKLADDVVAAEVGKPSSTDFGFDVGYLKKFGKELEHSFGFSIQNIGPPITFVDDEQADPAPTNMRLGIYTRLYKSDKSSLHLLFDANKLLVAAYPQMDWNGDGLINGSKEEHHTDDWYKAIFTAWLDDWYYGGDLNKCGSDCGNVSWATEIDYDLGTTNLDSRIGGYEPALFGWDYTTAGEVGGMVGHYNGEIYVPNYEHFCVEDQADCYLSDGTLVDDTNYNPDNIEWIDLPHDNLGNDDQQFFNYENPDSWDVDDAYGNCDIGINCHFDLPYQGEYSFGDSEYGIYNVFGDKEKGTGDERKFVDELEEMIYNIGFEWWYTEHFAMRVGYIHDEEGDVKNPTFGAGLKFSRYGFDFGYTAGDKNHPRANTMFFSLSLGL